MSQGQMIIAKRYLHIGFHFNGPPRVEELEPFFVMLADDWIRYSNNCWIVWTKYEPVTWFNTLKPQLGPYDHMLILEVTKGQMIQAWVPQWVWDWLNKLRS